MRPIHAAFAASLAVCGAMSHMPATAQADALVEQRVLLASFDFSPHELHLQAGKAYALVLTNTASGGHNFSAPEFFAAARVQPADAGLVAKGAVEVPGQSTRTIHLVPAAGTYRLSCTHTMHSMLGMKGQIVVE